MEKTKTAFIIEAVDEKLGLVKNREKELRDFAGWLSHKEAEELRRATAVFDDIQEGDWVLMFYEKDKGVRISS
jgi:hypothetical protein